MRVLVFGGTGQLGKGMVDRLLRSDEIDDVRVAVENTIEFCIAPRSIDVSDLHSLSWLVTDFQPDWIINAAAYTQVDAAELNPHQSISTNSSGAANVALCAQRVGAKLVYFSTESVFDGNSMAPYFEGDARNPLSVYSISKHAGEDLTREICEDSFILRTSWLYGDSNVANFPGRLLAKLSLSEGPVPVVTDLVGNPTPVELLVDATFALMQSPPEVGTYHVCTSGSATKNEWAKAIARSRGFTPDRIVSAKSSDFATAARRSKHVILSCEKFIATGLLELPPWDVYYHATKATPH